jgi:hypothetical protein
LCWAQLLLQQSLLVLGSSRKTSAPLELGGHTLLPQPTRTVTAAMLMTSNWDLALVHPVVIIKQSIDKLNNNVLLQSRSRLNSLDSNHPSQPFCLQFSPDLNLEDPQPKFIHEQLAI